MAHRDLEAIRLMHWSVLQRAWNADQYAAHRSELPNYVAVEDDDLLAFVSCMPFAPDVLEIANILVVPGMQNRGLGTRLLRQVLSDAPEHYRAVVATNSDLYEGGVSGKRDATAFYRRCGFELLTLTPDTRLFSVCF